jgi:hypothetical protein
MAPNIPQRGAVIPGEQGIFARIGARIAKTFAGPKANTRRSVKNGYPKTGTGERQGARVAAMVRNAYGDPFAASNACLAAIKARIAKAGK